MTVDGEPFEVQVDLLAGEYDGSEQFTPYTEGAGPDGPQGPRR